MSDFRFVYFEDPDEFPEVLDFMETCTTSLGISVEKLPEFKVGISELLADGIVRAVLIGTRRGDPDGGESTRSSLRLRMRLRSAIASMPIPRQLPRIAQHTLERFSPRLRDGPR